MILSLPHCWKQKFQQLSEDFSVFRIENPSESFFTGNGLQMRLERVRCHRSRRGGTSWPVNQAGGRPLG